MQIDKDELIRRIKAARLVDCSDPEAAVLAIIAEMQEPVTSRHKMKILDTTNGHIHEYGSNPHDSLLISQDGCALHYYNLQCGDGSMFGAYRFVMEDGKIPAESQTADAMYAECYFNIGGFGNSQHKPADWQLALDKCIREDQRPHGKWMKEIIVEEPRKNKRAYARCTECGVRFNHYKFAVLHFDFCPKCGADMRPKEESEK